MLWIYLILGISSALLFLKWISTPKPKNLHGKTVLITGGGSGIGKRMAYFFAKEGCNLVLWDLRKELLEHTVQDLKNELATNVSISIYVCDVSDRAFVQHVAETVQKEVGKIDILVNNAGIVTGKPLLELTDDQIVRTMDVNCMAHFWTVRAFLPAMIKANDGHIVTIASCMGMTGGAGLSDYCASKFAAVGLHESLRFELQKTNIGTLLVCPYAIQTGMFHGLNANHQWLLPYLEPDQVAKRVVEGVKNNELMMILPHMLWWFHSFTKALPTYWSDMVVNFFGGGNAMTNFKGRGIEFAMAKKTLAEVK